MYMSSSIKKLQESSKEILNIQSIVERIFQDIYSDAFVASVCSNCNSNNIECVDNTNSIYKCNECGYSFSPRTNSLFQKIKYSNDKWYKILTCMIGDFTLEETIKYVQSNPESVQRKWMKIYESINWQKYNVKVREKPTKNIYANFEVILS